MAVTVGEQVPDFQLKATNGETITLSEFYPRHKAVVITCFPLAFTSG